MNNYERIKSMSLDEMAEFIDYISTQTFCEYCKPYAKTCGNNDDCLSDIKQYLESEVDND